MERVGSFDDDYPTLFNISQTKHKASVVGVFQKASFYVTWDIKSRTPPPPRIELEAVQNCECMSFLQPLCLFGTSEDVAPSVTSNDMILFGSSSEEDTGGSIIEYSVSSNRNMLISRLNLSSAPFSVCYIKIGGKRKAFVGCEDGCIFLVEPFDPSKRKSSDQSENEPDPDPGDAVPKTPLTPFGARLIGCCHAEARIGGCRPQ